MVAHSELWTRVGESARLTVPTKGNKMLPSLKVYRTWAVCLKDFILSGAYRSKLPLLFLAIVACISAGRVASAQDRDPLDLLTEESEQTVTTGHIPRPTSKIAENITVITADDIARIN